MDDDASASESGIKFAVRLSWGLAGPLTLFFLGAYILRDGRPPSVVPSRNSMSNRRSARIRTRTPK